MLVRISVVALNAYREAVRARILMGLFALAVATAGYALIVANYASKSALRVISDVGSMSISLYSVLVAVILGATSLYREVELKTIFPILARPVRRGEYLLGKFSGTQLTLAVFMMANAGLLMVCLGVMAATDSGIALRGPGLVLAVVLICALVAWKAPKSRSWVPIWGALALFLAGYSTSPEAIDDRRVILCSVVLSWLEVGVIVSVATLFSAFTSPFLTAVFTVGVFVVGRSADTLARLPQRLFGPTIHELGVWLSKLFPNLMVYVPSRLLLTGEAVDVQFLPYLGVAALQAGMWVLGLLLVSAFLFGKRDFT